MSKAVSHLVGGMGKPRPQTPAQAQEARELAEAVNKEARERWHDPAFHREAATLVEQRIDYGFTNENPFVDYVNTETVGEFDKVKVTERRGLKVFATSRGGSVDESTIRTQEWELPRDTLAFHVSEHEDEVRANFSQTLSDLVSLGADRMTAETYRRFLTLLQTAIPTGSPYEVDAVDLTKTVLDTAIDEVRDAVQPNGVGIQPVTVLGRVAAIAQINDFNMGFDPEATAEIRAKGRLGVYRGATIQQLVHYVDEDDLPYMPANEVWVFSGNVGKFAFYGGATSKTWTENTVDF